MTEKTEIEISDSTRKIMDSFDELWARVSAKPPQAIFDEDETLREFIRSELCTASFDSALARMLQNPGRATLSAHANAAKLRARRLRGEYFIRSGVSYTPKEPCRGVTGKLASLRMALERDIALAKSYASAAEQTAQPELGQLYTAFAAERQNAAKETRLLILDSF